MGYICLIVEFIIVNMVSESTDRYHRPHRLYAKCAKDGNSPPLGRDLWAPCRGRTARNGVLKPSNPAICCV